MLNRPIDLFEFPTNLGLRKKFDEIEPGVKELLAWLNRQGLFEKLNVEAVYRLSAPSYSINFNEKTGLLNENQVIEYAKRQSLLLEKQLENENFKLIVGGDCSILIGTALALRKKGAYGLFFWMAI